MSFCSKLYSYFRLCLNVKNYYTMYLETKQHDLELLQYVTDSISECGAITIKFCQWITPKLELIYLDGNDILNENKPNWLLYLEKYYDKCPNHDLNFTKEEYKRVFHRNIEDDYVIDKILGSGSIGQVYLVTNKLTQKKKLKTTRLQPMILSTKRN